MLKVYSTMSFLQRMLIRKTTPCPMELNEASKDLTLCKPSQIILFKANPFICYFEQKLSSLRTIGNKCSTPHTIHYTISKILMKHLKKIGKGLDLVQEVTFSDASLDQFAQDFSTLILLTFVVQILLCCQGSLAHFRMLSINPDLYSLHVVEFLHLGNINWQYPLILANILSGGKTITLGLESFPSLSKNNGNYFGLISTHPFLLLRCYFALFSKYVQAFFG